nr:rod shape-determining protein [Lachnospiraceae bacterium]
ERTPPELAADIYRKGVYITGGASLVSNFAQSVADGTGLKVNLAADPISSVCNGIKKIIHDNNYKSLAYSIEGMSK